MFRVTTALFMIGLVTLSTIGCQEPEEYDPSPRPGLGDPIPPPYNSPDITVIDGDLQKWLGFHPAVVVRSEGSPLSVEVPVRNLGDDQYVIQYRFTFYDEGGSVIDPVMQWDRAVLQPRATHQLRANALNDRAETWKLQVRWAR